MRNPFRRRARDNPGTASLIIVVLLASMVVATVLAAQAIVAARERRAISEAMLRQYAELAAWEFSRQARRDVEQSLMHTLRAYAHPETGRHAAESCNCGQVAAVEQWFEVTSRGEVKTTSEAVRASLIDVAVPAAVPEGGAAEGQLRTLALKGDGTRFIALKQEPHLAEGGQIGLVSTAESLRPVLSRTYARAALLPAVLADSSEARSFVDLRITDGSGATVFRSGETTPGPYVVDTALLPGLEIPLTAHASMTPAFIAGLGPAHGTGPRTALVVTLVVVNALLMVVGLRQLTRERELTRLRTDFVAGVSHELRTPLAQIRMFSETLLLDRVRNTDERRRALEIIGQESKRLTQLVDNVLHFHRRTSPQDNGASESIDLKAFAHDVIESFEPLAAAKGAHLAAAFTADEVVIRGDADGLRQVLLNLLDNAVKFGPAGQTVTVRVEHENGAAILTVDDGGPGVPAADRVRIFKAFERGRHTHGTGGAGIGLAVVRQIVLAHRGNVSVENNPGGGSRFRIMLPQSDAA